MFSPLVGLNEVNWSGIITSLNDMDSKDVSWDELNFHI